MCVIRIVFEWSIACIDTDTFSLTCLKWFSVSGLFSHISVMSVTPVIKIPAGQRVSLLCAEVALPFGSTKFREMTHRDFFRLATIAWPAEISPSNLALGESPETRTTWLSFECTRSVISSNVPLHWPNRVPFPVRRSRPMCTMPSRPQIASGYSNHCKQSTHAHI